MPTITHPIAANGPAIDVTVGICAVRLMAKQQAQQPIPPSAVLHALIDTGANHSCIRLGLAAQLQLRQAQGAAAAIGALGQQVNVSYFHATVTIPGMNAMQLRLAEYPLTGFHDLIIGCDVLNLGTLTYDGPNQQFTLTLP